ncbi:MAG: hypothetical protein P1U47_16785 [Zhongshania sp.]|uniref:hypothetical protein n=1 Tax=Zhongshania sp. TaxID=1971902 RepID=UPI00262E5AEA|nr:hypothetical protein [Zhongshania sp.]MDF1694028.1 hypothetical protein [Zhongshania sp.]
MDLPEISAINALRYGAKAFDLAHSAYNSHRDQCLFEFFRVIDTRLDTMDKTGLDNFYTYLESPTGKQRIGRYIDCALNTYSRRARTAIALLLADSPSHRFKEAEKATFIKAMTGMEDSVLDFFLAVCKLPRDDTKYAYPQAMICASEKEALGFDKWEDEEIFINISELIRLRVLAPNPSTVGVIQSGGKSWALWFGVTNISLKMVKLLEESEHMNDVYSSLER